MNRWFVQSILLTLSLTLSPAVLSGNEIKPFLTSLGVADPPFSAGETLLYEVNWKPMFLLPAFKAGEIELQIGESEFNGVDTFRIVGKVYSEGALTRITGLTVNNRFESFIDRSNLRSYQITQIIRQGKRKRDLRLRFDYEKNRTVILETDPSFNPPRVLRNLVKPEIPAPVADVLSVFYIARCRTLNEGERFYLHLNENGNLKRVDVVAGSRELIRTPVGEFPSIKLTTSSGIFKGGGELRIWYSTDSLRIPTRFEADVRLGKVHGELIRMDSPTLTRGILRLGAKN